jgi:pectate lyase
MRIRHHARRATVLAALAALSAGAGAQTQASDRDVAPASGWAGQNGGTTGGSQAAAADVFTVADKASFVAALAAAGERPKIIRVNGLIDFREGREYTDSADQQERGTVDIPPNTTLIGINANAGFQAVQLRVKGKSGVKTNVILRNLTIETPFDVDPPDDDNAEFDAVQITNFATNVWVDHVTLTDGSRTKNQTPGEVHHDGALDVTNSSNFVTVSNSLFKNHDKTNLIGSSDNRTEDRGLLKVTFNDNVWDDISQRAPRVRFGQVHVYNNLHLGDADDPEYPVSVVHGIGVESAILSESNVIDLANFDAADACDLLDLKGGTTYKNIATTLNGVAVDMSCGLSADIGWEPPYDYVLKSAALVREQAAVDVGAGKLVVVLDGEPAPPPPPPPPAPEPAPPAPEPAPEPAPPPVAEAPADDGVVAAEDDGGGATGPAGLAALFAAVLAAGALRPRKLRAGETSSTDAPRQA